FQFRKIPRQASQIHLGRIPISGSRLNFGSLVGQVSTNTDFITRGNELDASVIFMLRRPDGQHHEVAGIFAANQTGCVLTQEISEPAKAPHLRHPEKSARSEEI